MTVDATSVIITALITSLTGGATAIWRAMVTGKLIFGRELEERDKRIVELTNNYKLATDAINLASARERDSLQQSLAASEQRVADLGRRFDSYLDQQGKAG